ncbi:isochorismatase family cysteine hydrolase [Moorella naiadis]|uniref:cysteine hydrolase family protein n=1 Tax=Moorella naiadis (nom. illeg.) TaxID=3093670 RepID=UPI003D9C83BD
MAKKALLIIDMQNDFVGPQPVMQCEGGREIIPSILELISNARQADIPIIHIIQEHRRQMADFGRELDVSPPHCLEGTTGARIIEEIKVEPEDLIVIKRRFSGFLGTDLDLLLHGMQVDTLIIAGVATDGCIRATAVDAHQLGYHVHVIADCVAGAKQDSHQAALAYLARLQPKGVIKSADLIPENLDF